MLFTGHTLSVFLAKCFDKNCQKAVKKDYLVGNYIFIYTYIYCMYCVIIQKTIWQTVIVTIFLQ